jgi:hypothetical protein
MAAPVNSVLPLISGTIEVGEMLDCTEGTWTGSPTSYAYQWQRVGDSAVDIDGATSSHYVISALSTEQTLRCVVTAANDDGSTSATSLETTTVPDDWFVVEDGTGLVDAVSYLSVADADLYHARRGNTSWATMSNGAKKAALVKATEYLGQIYRMVWKGTRVNGTQALDWPRAYVLRDFPSDEVLVEVKNATAIMALKSISGELISDLTQGVIREKVDVLEVEYDKNSPQWVRYREIDNLLRPLLTSSGSNRKLLRV